MQMAGWSCYLRVFLLGSGFYGRMDSFLMLSSNIIHQKRGHSLYGPKCLLKSAVLAWPTYPFSHITELFGDEKFL